MWSENQIRLLKPFHKITFFFNMEMNMDELVKEVSENAGISEEQAKKAIETVRDFLKDKLPDPLAGQVDNVLESGQAADFAGDLTKSLGGLFGKK
jgi:uncharacterized protein (DUF2267 family)